MTQKRLSVSLTGTRAEFLEKYLKTNPELRSGAAVVGRGFGFLALVEGLADDEELVIRSKSAPDRVVSLPWREHGSSTVNLPTL